MEKMNWKEPQIMVDCFQPDEYVAACFQLACLRGPDNQIPYGDLWSSSEYGMDIRHSVYGTPNTCSDVNANRVVTSDGGIFESVGEFNKIQGWIDGGVDVILDKNENGITDAGDIIYWHTLSADRTRKWNHWGVLEQQDSNHPNHS